MFPTIECCPSALRLQRGLCPCLPNDDCIRIGQTHQRIYVASKAAIEAYDQSVLACDHNILNWTNDIETGKAHFRSCTLSIGSADMSTVPLRDRASFIKAGISQA